MHHWVHTRRPSPPRSRLHEELQDAAQEEDRRGRGRPRLGRPRMDMRRFSERAAVGGCWPSMTGRIRDFFDLLCQGPVISSAGTDTSCTDMVGKIRPFPPSA